MFSATFGQAIVTVRPGQLIGSGKDRINSQLVCIAGDEKTVSVPGCMYITPQHPVPGVGTLSIASLGPDQTAVKTKSSSQPVLLKGSSFQAKFQVVTPAQKLTAAGPVTDPTPQYLGAGHFITSNHKIKGT